MDMQKENCLLTHSPFWGVIWCFVSLPRRVQRQIIASFNLIILSSSHLTNYFVASDLIAVLYTTVPRNVLDDSVWPLCALLS